ncbi:MAG: response regulator [Nanoarchaeota archaeon]|nr:response regulator [Nanoarchaeota archaeon]
MTEKQLELLVVEDTPSHMEDVQTLLKARVEAGVKLQVDYASTLQEAQEKLAARRYDGIMSDLFFPEKVGEETSDLGTQVARYALQQKIPFVIVTSTYHHGRKTESASRWLRDDVNIGLIDASTEDRDGEAIHKNWRGGYLTLMYFIEAVQEGVVTFKGQRVEGKVEPTEKGQRYYDLRSLTADLINNMDYHEKQGELSDYVQGRGESNPVFGLALQKYCQGMF